MIVDVDNNSTPEIVATGNMYQCTSGYPSKYNAVFIFNADRSRFNNGT